MRFTKIHWLIVAALLVLLAACGPSATPAPTTAPAAAPTTAAAAPTKPAAPAATTAPATGALKKLKVGAAVSPPKLVHTPPNIAVAKGFFAKYGLDVEVIPFEGGQALTRAAQAGQLDLGSCSNVTVSRGQKCHIFWGQSMVYPNAMIVQPEIKTIQDLKGKRVAIEAPGGNPELWTRQILATVGMTGDDVKWVITTTAGQTAALVNGQVDAIIDHTENTFRAAKEKPGVHVLVQLADAFPNSQFNQWGGDDKQVQARRQDFVNFTAALIETNRWIYKNKDEFLKLAAAVTNNQVEYLSPAYDIYVQRCIWSVNTGIVKAKVEWTNENSLKLGEIVAGKAPKFEDFYDLTISNEALKLAGGAWTGTETPGKCTY